MTGHEYHISCDKVNRTKRLSGYFSSRTQGEITYMMISLEGKKIWLN